MFYFLCITIIMVTSAVKVNIMNTGQTVALSNLLENDVKIQRNGSSCVKTV